MGVFLFPGLFSENITIDIDLYTYIYIYTDSTQHIINTNFDVYLYLPTYFTYVPTYLPKFSSMNLSPTVMEIETK